VAASQICPLGHLNSTEAPGAPTLACCPHHFSAAGSGAGCSSCQVGADSLGEGPLAARNSAGPACEAVC